MLGGRGLTPPSGPAPRAQPRPAPGLAHPRALSLPGECGTCSVAVLRGRLAEGECKSRRPGRARVWWGGPFPRAAVPGRRPSPRPPGTAWSRHPQGGRRPERGSLPRVFGRTPWEPRLAESGATSCLGAGLSCSWCTVASAVCALLCEPSTWQSKALVSSVLVLLHLVVLVVILLFWARRN